MTDGADHQRDFTQLIYNLTVLLVLVTTTLKSIRCMPTLARWTVPWVEGLYFTLSRRFFREVKKSETLQHVGTVPPLYSMIAWLTTSGPVGRVCVRVGIAELIRAW